MALSHITASAHACLPWLQVSPEQQEQEQQQQQQAEQGVEEQQPTDLVEESRSLRGDGHRIQAANIALSMRFDDTVKKLESRGDHEARKVLMRLAKEVCPVVN